MEESRSQDETAQRDPAPSAGGAACRNCGKPAGPHFCGHCGQRVEERRGPVFTLLGELFAEWLSLDGRLVRSLRALAVPGQLTRRYLAGHRAPYLSPFRLYALASLVLFSSALNLRPPDASQVNLYIAGELVTSGEASARKINYTLFAKDSQTFHWLSQSRSDMVERLKQQPAQKTLDEIFTGLGRLLPTTLVLSLPLFALALKLLYLRRRVLYVDHLVFTVHLQSALFIALALGWLVARVLRLGPFPSFVIYLGAGLAVLLGYLPVALHRVYTQSRWLTAAKTGLLVFGYAYVLQLVIGVTLIGVLGRM